MASGLMHSIGLRDNESITVRTIIYEGEEVIHFADRVMYLTHKQFEECYKKWNSGSTIEEAFPTLSSLERGFLLNGNMEVVAEA